MNLNAIAMGVIPAVNPNETFSIQESTGYVTQRDSSRVPQYAAPFSAVGQMQPMTWKELQQVDGLNLNGTKRAIYFNGDVEAIVRVSKQGGSLITDPLGNVWLVVLVLEHWVDAGWCKVAIVLQNGS